ncbi:cupin domain-containing protein [Acinetobacter courvalinii]|uniref:(R)-mandelonitrile lyase n=1 Tax=Acinetobacter courvalinii TaxID=280147 RepID=UPI00292A5CAD|nr:cupin domain-containing protein [Acinetobacter courvalinii]MCU4578445.1 cupin domain-containing protein [Acinetobacter courvalinii]
MDLKTTLFITTFFLFSTGVQAMDKTKNMPVQSVKKASEQQVIQGSDQIFTGTVAIRPLTEITDGINAPTAYVSFNANSRSFWHTHPKGQYLIVTEGEGIVQEWGKPAEKIGVGDVIHCPPNVKHWHGARTGSSMTHLALTGTDEHGKNVDWLEPVSDEQYQKANQ